MKELNERSNNKKTVTELAEENEKLRIEIDALKRELERTKGRKAHHSTDPISAAFDRQAVGSRLFSKKSYSAYLVGLITNTSIFKLYGKILGYARKYSFITTTLKIFSFIFAFLQTSAVFIIAASFFLVSLPLTFLVGYAAILLTVFGKKRAKKKVRSAICGKKITVLFPQKGRALAEDSFFSGMARDICRRTGGVAIVVSPYFFSTRGISKNKKMFLSMRDEGGGVLLVRRHFFFSLKRNVLKNRREDITVIY